MIISPLAGDRRRLRTAFRYLDILPAIVTFSFRDFVVFEAQKMGTVSQFFSNHAGGKRLFGRSERLFCSANPSRELFVCGL